MIENINEENIELISCNYVRSELDEQPEIVVG
jgi:hypothetical protein